MDEIIFDDRIFISKEEMYTYWYLAELKLAGYIDDLLHQPKPSIVIPKKMYKTRKKLKTKNKIVDKTFLQELTYQPDFAIRWNEKALGILIPLEHEDYKDYPFFAHHQKTIFSIIDVKGNFNQNDAHRRFSIEQKVIYHMKGVYVQKIMPLPKVSKNGKITSKDAIFYKSFVPERFLLTDVSLRPRKINFEYKTLKEYVRNKENKMETLSTGL